MIKMWNDINHYSITKKSKEIRTIQAPDLLRKIPPLTYYFFTINHNTMDTNIANQKMKKNKK